MPKKMASPPPKTLMAGGGRKWCWTCTVVVRDRTVDKDRVVRKRADFGVGCGRGRRRQPQNLRTSAQLLPYPLSCYLAEGSVVGRVWWWRDRTVDKEGVVWKRADFGVGCGRGRRRQPQNLRTSAQLLPYPLFCYSAFSSYFCLYYFRKHGGHTVRERKRTEESDKSGKKGEVRTHPNPVPNP